METKTYSFERLHVWNDIRDLIKNIYSITTTLPENERFGLVSQMRRAAISVSSNVAEGSSRKSAKDQAHFYQIAYSSLMELLSQVIVSYDLNYINDESHQVLRDKIQGITFKINSLRNATLKRTQSN